MSPEGRILCELMATTFAFMTLTPRNCPAQLCKTPLAGWSRWRASLVSDPFHEHYHVDNILSQKFKPSGYIGASSLITFQDDQLTSYSPTHLPFGCFGVYPCRLSRYDEMFINSFFDFTIPGCSNSWQRSSCCK